MDKNLGGKWEKFEQWIRDTICSDFRWLVQPRDSAPNRDMVADLILKDIKRNNGISPGKNMFIEKQERKEGSVIMKKIKVAMIGARNGSGVSYTCYPMLRGRQR